MENNTVFVLLAGGKSSRMGLAKGLLKYKHSFWILEQLQRISQSSVKEVYIGLGYDHDHYFIAIPWLKTAIKEAVTFLNLTVHVVVNYSPERGSFSTLQTVLKGVESSKNVLILPIDVPLCKGHEIDKITSVENGIVQPHYTEKNGHPIKLSTQFWSSLLSLDILDKNSRLDYQIKALSSQDIARIPIDNQNIVLNLNTRESWRSYISGE